MFRNLCSTLVLATLGWVSGAQAQAAAPTQPTPKPSSASARRSVPKQSAADFAYRNATTPPISGWTGPVFQLSHSYPQQDPGTCPSTVCTWLANEKVSFTGVPAQGQAPAQWTPAWQEYMQQLLAYIREGQDLQLDNTAGWQLKVKDTTRWFHMPWMAYDSKQGREFIHGLTNERTASLSDFHGQLQLQKGVNALSTGKGLRETAEGYETWAFGVYNEWGGYAIGRTWQPDGKPLTTERLGGPQPAGLPFPDGTLVAKLLFTTATPQDVSYLQGSPVWQAYRHVEWNDQYLCERQVQEVRLVQLDVAVVDHRSPTRWVFGTFAYNGEVNGATVWDRLVPVGVQWGNDPWSWPATSRADSLALIQSVINPAIIQTQHLGCHGRLAGPVDNRASSCMACHANGYTPPAGKTEDANTIPPLFGFNDMCVVSSPDNANYFTNNLFPMPYAGGQYPNLMNMDTSLQMWVAFLQYGQFNQVGQPKACVEPNGKSSSR
ncbi:hypothetical protein POL68_24340 [Stigmatella sp. ncwal1]|uniref:Cytochrome c domain-containing protein n=1 Tax=Stigmatella ashevillensis TaxID=2995309 RepID=A0ABT5DDP3_9BACT|nr:hypothetical protein [Stigmatella ashevillena]MDC0711621.1 hypothetical protein [Stigmatella ashevillena]